MNLGTLTEYNPRMNKTDYLSFGQALVSKP